MKRCPRCSRTFDDERLKFCRVGSENDQIQFARIQARGFECLATRVCGEVRRAFIVRTDVSLMNAQDLRDKVVDVFTENPAQIVVCDDLFRNVDAGANNVCKLHDG